MQCQTLSMYKKNSQGLDLQWYCYQELEKKYCMTGGKKPIQILYHQTIKIIWKVVSEPLK